MNLRSILIGVGSAWFLTVNLIVINMFFGIGWASIGFFLMLLLIITMGYVIYNQFQKNIFLEQWIESFTGRIIHVQEELERIDSTGVFKSDDEVGFVFNEINEVVGMLSDLVEDENGKKKEEE